MVTIRESERIARANLELLEKWMLRVIRNPRLLEGVPEGATIVLYPVPVEKE